MSWSRRSGLSISSGRAVSCVLEHATESWCTPGPNQRPFLESNFSSSSLYIQTEPSLVVTTAIDVAALDASDPLTSQTVPQLLGVVALRWVQQHPTRVQLLFQQRRLVRVQLRLIVYPTTVWTGANTLCHVNECEAQTTLDQCCGWAEGRTHAPSCVVQTRGVAQGGKAVSI